MPKQYREHIIQFLRMRNILSVNSICEYINALRVAFLLYLFLSSIVYYMYCALIHAIIYLKGPCILDVIIIFLKCCSYEKFVFPINCYLILKMINNNKIRD